MTQPTLQPMRRTHHKPGKQNGNNCKNDWRNYLHPQGPFFLYRCWDRFVSLSLIRLERRRKFSEIVRWRVYMNAAQCGIMVYPFHRVAQYFPRFLYLSETFFPGSPSAVLIRVIPKYQFSIGCANLHGRCILRHAQYGIVVLYSHCSKGLQKRGKMRTRQACNFYLSVHV